jgi:hypothetical protein
MKQFSIERLDVTCIGLTKLLALQTYTKQKKQLNQIFTKNGADSFPCSFLSVSEENSGKAH